MPSEQSSSLDGQHDFSYYNAIAVGSGAATRRIPRRQPGNGRLYSFLYVCPITLGRQSFLSRTNWAGVTQDRLKARLQFDAIETGELFPHLYGALNLDAVVQVLEFEPEVDGSFLTRHS